VGVRRCPSSVPTSGNSSAPMVRCSRALQELTRWRSRRRPVSAAG
jgi:uncharacterized protein YjiS (DUF1127 family)